MDKEIIKYKNIASGIAILMLLLAVPAGLWPYGYYVFLRWIVASAALFNLWTAYNLQKMGWVWIMASIALLFNPILPIYLTKGIWVFLDLVIALVFFIAIFKINLR